MRAVRKSIGPVLRIAAASAAFAALVPSAALAVPRPAVFKALSANGAVVAFTTAESLVPNDADNAVDVYTRTGGVTAIASDRPSGDTSTPATFRALSGDGSIVVFTTAESLVPNDADNAVDVYTRTGGVTAIASDRPSGDTSTPATFRALSGDGSIVVFTTAESLVPNDADNAVDVYTRTGGVTAIASDRPSGDTSTPATFRALSGDGSIVVFTTAESLVPNDADNAVDVYTRTGGVTAIASDRPSGDTSTPATFRALSGDGSIVVFTTAESLVPNDADNAVDVYTRTGGVTAIASDRPSGDTSTPATFRALSGDGSIVVFTTAESLVPNDADNAVDVYTRTGGVTAIASDRPSGDTSTPATFRALSGDGSIVVFTTAESLVPNDADNAVDVYTRTGGVTAIASDRPSGDTSTPATFRALSGDGSIVVFTTAESLVPNDADNAVDVYTRTGGVTAIASDRPSGDTSTPATFRALSGDGSIVVFTTAESLVPNDADNAVDVYTRTGGVTAIASDRPSGDTSTPATFRALSGDGSRVIFVTAEPLAFADSDTLTDVYSRAGGVTELVSD